MSKKLKKKLTGIVTSVIVVIVVLVLDNLQVINIEDYLTENDSYKEMQNIEPNIDSTFYEVTRVVDGDTFVINYKGKEEKVRLIGVDTPESVHPDEEKNTEFGEQVSNYTKEMLLGKSVQLEFDVDERDQYGRLLAYVYLNGQMYNKMLLEKGYAKIATFPPNVKYVEDFKTLQKEARENKVGLWGY